MTGCHASDILGPRYLSVDNIIEANQIALRVTPGEQFGIIKLEQLHSAQSRPSVYRHYEQNGDVFVLAAVLFKAIIQAHAFVNANKRTAFLSSQAFLRLNGYNFIPTESDSINISLKVATGEDEYLDEHMLSSWFKSFSTLLEDGN
ncbi:MAG: death-on-curing protein [Alteromonadaceae bacterium]|jgi:death-on-curing protein